MLNSHIVGCSIGCVQFYIDDTDFCRKRLDEIKQCGETYFSRLNGYYVLSQFNANILFSIKMQRRPGLQTMMFTNMAF